MLATMCYMQSGTPFIYQGQEIGMLNNKLDSLSQFKDVVTFNNQKLFKKFGIPDSVYLRIANKTSRENARTPVQWNDTEYAGFSTAEPWFKVNKNYKEINVAEEERNPDSILNYYRWLLKVRKGNKLIVYGDYKEHYKRSKNLYCYERNYRGQRALVVASFTDKPIKFKAPAGFKLDSDNLLIYTYPDAREEHTDSKTITLRPYEALVWEYK